MTKDDEWEMVIRLACLTEDRAEVEQRVLLTVAQDLDTKRNKMLGLSNRYRYDEAGHQKKGFVPSNLFGLVEETYRPEGGPVGLPPKGSAKVYERRARRLRMEAEEGG